MDTLSSWSRFRITSYDTHFALTDEYSIGELRTCMHLSLKLSKSKDVRLKCRPGYKTQTVHHENYFRLFNSEKSSMYWYSRSHGHSGPRPGTAWYRPASISSL